MNKKFVLNRLHELNINQAELARRLSMSPCKISRILSGDRALQACEVLDFALALQYPPSYILNNLGNKP